MNVRALSPSAEKIDYGTKNDIGFIKRILTRCNPALSKLLSPVGLHHAF